MPLVSAKISLTNHLPLSLGQLLKETWGMPGDSEEQQHTKPLARCEDTAASVRCGRISPAASGT